MLQHATEARPFLENGLGVGSQDAKQVCLRFDFLKRLAHVVILGMATDIDKKYVVPLSSPGRSGFDSCHADIVTRERIQQVMQNTGSFGTAGGQQQRGLVIPARREELTTDDQEASRVIEVILDVRK